MEALSAFSIAFDGVLRFYRVITFLYIPTYQIEARIGSLYQLMACLVVFFCGITFPLHMEIVGNSII